MNDDDEELTAEELERMERNKREAELRRSSLASLSAKKPFVGVGTSNAFQAFAQKRKRIVDDDENDADGHTNNSDTKRMRVSSSSMSSDVSTLKTPSTPLLNRGKQQSSAGTKSVTRQPVLPSPQQNNKKNATTTKKKEVDNDYEDAEDDEDEDAEERQKPASTSSTRRGATSKPNAFARAKQKRDEEERHTWLMEGEIRDKEQRKKDHPDYDPSTLYIPAAGLSEMTPFEKQYWEVKKENWDTVIFFKKGKFYELYEKDAYLGKELFDLKMTERVNMPMVGVPEGSFQHWASKFIAAGCKLARVEQMETPDEVKKRNKGKKQAKNATSRVVSREIVEIITPGTIRDNDMIMDYNSPYLLSIRENQVASSFGISFSDVSTGRIFLTFIERDDAGFTGLETVLQQIQPREILFEKGNLSKQTLHIIKQKLNISAKLTPIASKEYYDASAVLQQIEDGEYFEQSEWPEALNEFRENEIVLCSFGGLLFHLKKVMLDSDVLTMGNIKKYEPNEHASTMIIDGQTLANLEILCNNRDNTRKGSLIEHLDRCLTPFGKRLFRKWICAPLRRIEDINARLDALEDLHRVSEAKDEVRPLLKQIPDLERMLAKLHSESRIEKDAVYFDVKTDKRKIDMFLGTLDGFKKINNISKRMNQLINEFETDIMKDFSQIVSVSDVNDIPDHGFPDIDDLLNHFDGAFDHKIAKEQYIICPNEGEDEEYDKVVQLIKKTEAEFEEELKKARKLLKCASAQYKHLQKDTYQIEVPNNVKVPDTFTVVTKTSKMNRYYTPWIRENLSKLQELESQKEEVLRRQMKRMFKKFDAYYKIWARAIEYCSELDCLFSLSLTSFESHLPMVRPSFVNSRRPVFDIKQMIHPCVSSPNASTPIQPNDTLLGGLNHPCCAVVTGPNMGGKSTLLRQNCIAIIMAQVGCYVSAQEFTLSPVDRIFTRIGANDKIMAGESTFMVELNETSNIINNATRNSFVILDEMGRGTSTFDGLSMAFSVVQYLAEKTQCRTLFSTHYYNLTEQLKFHPLIAMYQMECHVNPENKKDITFLYKYSPGVCPKSYGMNVASMAGVDSKIVDRASQIAEMFEQNLEKQSNGTVVDSSRISREQTQRFLNLNVLLHDDQNNANDLRARLRKLQSGSLAELTSFLSQ